MEQEQARLRFKRSRLLSAERALLRQAALIEATAKPLRDQALGLQAERLELERRIVPVKVIPATRNPSDCHGTRANKKANDPKEVLRKRAKTMSREQLLELLGEA